jgi:N-methylhydantoinase B
VTLNGVDDGDKPYVFTFFSSGGMGARANKDGLDATAFPSNVANVPVEVMEQAVPVLMRSRELIPGSFGKGRHRGGAGQRISLELRTRHSASISCMVERTASAPRGFLNGKDGRPAQLLIDDQSIDAKQSHLLKPGQLLVLETPGGGGYGPTDSASQNGDDHG